MSVELKQYEDKMNKTLDSLSGEYTTIRAGRANPHVLDKITVGKHFGIIGTYSGDSALGGKPDQGD